MGLRARRLLFTRRMREDEIEGCQIPAMCAIRESWQPWQPFQIYMYIKDFESALFRRLPRLPLFPCGTLRVKAVIGRLV
jgi:hypothetical protein